MLPRLSREELGQESIVEIPDGGGDCQPVEETQVAGADQNRLEDYLPAALEDPASSQGKEGEKGKAELNHVVAEGLEHVFEYLSIYCSLKKTLLDNVLSKIQGDDRMRIKIILNFMTAV